MGTTVDLTLKSSQYIKNTQYKYTNSGNLKKMTSHHAYTKIHFTRNIEYMALQDHKMKTLLLKLSLPTTRNL